MPQRDTLSGAVGDHQRRDIELTDKRSTKLIQIVSTEANYAKPVEGGQHSITKSFVLLKEGELSMCRVFDSPRFEADEVALGILSDLVQFGPDLDVEVFKSTQLFVIQVKVPSTSRDHEVSWVRNCPGVQPTCIIKSLTTVPERTTPRLRSIPHSSQSVMGDPQRAQATVGDHQRCQKSKIRSRKQYQARQQSRQSDIDAKKRIFTSKYS